VRYPSLKADCFSLEKLGTARANLRGVADQDASAQTVDDYIRHLKSKIPPEEHAALDSRVQDLLDDANADTQDVVEALRREFEPR